MSGGEGNDTINGGDGSDVITAGAGADIVDGGAGNDTLAGGASSDIFLGGSAADMAGDVITDYIASNQTSQAAEVDGAEDGGAGGACGAAALSPPPAPAAGLLASQAERLARVEQPLMLAQPSAVAPESAASGTGNAAAQ